MGQRRDEDAVWLPVPTGIYDEDGDEYTDYVLAGTEPMTPFELMVFASAGIDCYQQPNPYIDQGVEQ